jgi:hypothetical protein
MKFSEYVTRMDEALRRKYPTAHPYKDPPGGMPPAAKKPYPVAQPYVPQQPAQEVPTSKTDDKRHQMWRIRKGQFTQEEKAIVDKQQKELAAYGVVFTPFKIYGGMENPQFDPTPFQFNK